MNQIVEAVRKLLETLSQHPGGVWIAIGLVLLMGLKLLLKIIGDGFGNPAGSETPKGFPYERAEFLSPAERSFFGALELALGARYRVFAKVRLADVIRPEKGLRGRRRHIALNQIIQKHLDFVLCDPATLAVLAVVELDDLSHRSSQQRERDHWKDQALKAAGIPVVRFPAARSYATAELLAGIEVHLGAMPATPAGPPPLTMSRPSP